MASLFAIPDLRATPLLVSGVAAFTLACGPTTTPTPEPEQAFLQIRGETMGTTYSVKIANHDFPAVSSKHMDEILERVNAQMSTYRPDSELSRFNRHTGSDPFAVSRETATVVARAREIAEASGGAFDATTGALVNLWSFGPEDVPRRIPTDEEIDEARATVGWSLVEASLDPPTLSKQVDGVYVDLSGIAKGFGVDELGRLLDAREYDGFLIDIGGDMLARGRKPGGEPWTIAIERPQAGLRSIQRRIELVDTAIATSGDYRNYFEQDGVRYSHTIDPRTGRPIRHQLASVSVLADDCMTADAWATALMVLGEAEGYTLAEANGLAALFLVRTDDGFDELATSAFNERFAD